MGLLSAPAAPRRRAQEEISPLRGYRAQYTPTKFNSRISKHAEYRYFLSCTRCEVAL
jgi:hypothetical protein